MKNTLENELREEIRKQHAEVKDLLETETVRKLREKIASLGSEKRELITDAIEYNRDFIKSLDIFIEYVEQQTPHDEKGLAVWKKSRKHMEKVGEELTKKWLHSLRLEELASHWDT